jgi:glutamyl-tRNA synthetase
MPFVKERAKTVVELTEQCAFALKSRPLVLDDKALKPLTDEAKARLGRLRDVLDHAAFEVEPLENLLKTFAESEGVGLGKIGPALRAALTGGSPAPDLAKILVALGKGESLGRIDDALSQSR